jgi:reactive chlorine resistance protein C
MSTLPGWNVDSAFPWLNGSGIFLLKDAFLLAATVLLLGVREPHGRCC